MFASSAENLWRDAWRHWIRPHFTTIEVTRMLSIVQSQHNTVDPISVMMALRWPTDALEAMEAYGLFMYHSQSRQEAVETFVKWWRTNPNAYDLLLKEVYLNAGSKTAG